MRPTGQVHAAPSDAAQAVAMVSAGLGWLAAADMAGLGGDAQAELLRELEAARAQHTAARSAALAAFTAGRGFEADGAGSAPSWLRAQTRVTGGAATEAIGWMKRLAAHPMVRAAMGGREISESWARQLCAWSDALPEDRRSDADRILLAAAAGGAGLADLGGLAEEMLRRCAPPDADADDGFGDRQVRLETHFRGAGKLDGDLTPECAAALAAVLESLGKKAGPEDDRTAGQRRHDALEEACRRLISAGGLPDVAGQPVQVQLHMTLDQMRNLPGAADAEQAWAAGRAAADGLPGWVRSRAASRAYACDAQLTPIVSGYVDPAVLEALVADYLASLRPGLPPSASPCPAGIACPHAGTRPGAAAAACPAGAACLPGVPCPAGPRCPRSSAGRDLPAGTRRRLQDTLLRYAADLLSGPAGLAAFLRASLLAAQFPAAVSLPLDVGNVVTIVPAHLRRAVAARDRHCAFPGCHQRPAACQVHHIIPRAQGGPTALYNLALLCPFHHLIAIHRWGWTLALNGDGTTTATSPDGKRILHSHGPPGPDPPPPDPGTHRVVA